MISKYQFSQNAGGANASVATSANNNNVNLSVSPPLVKQSTNSSKIPAPHIVGKGRASGAAGQHDEDDEDSNMLEADAGAVAPSEEQAYTLTTSGHNYYQPQ